ncbi:MAG: 6,7-dimethyl-8-ribityllumazine synthase [Candidatus Diapherotrites archaeon]|uniref:6,7-dimethyl-8-ribityllumazine synthase n=1 Tax=Candidatus Iainarchaeum sp. TaxID=3101447 RepID=A0A2D6LNY0_9ARCH|nr:6,7-dimethyl-8-ribityllumazine synthase [Candidatus Diapherotrites archaeon]|tara:strand:- start:9388 stop:9780 length:393 start_codon:yes stop_codon:yes gene_type:complete
MNIGIVVADFHKELSEEMLDYAKKTAKENNLNVVDVVKVTGAFDIPLPLQRMLANPSINGAVVLGAVVQGETSHDEIVAFTASQKITELSLKYDKPVGYGISGPRMTAEQAKARSKEFSVRAVEAVARML